MSSTQSKPSHNPESDLPIPNSGEENDDLTQVCKHLISSLPRQEAWAMPYFYQYQGFWHSSQQLQGVIACQHHFRAHDSDLLLVTNPKSGTTWLKALAYASLNRAKWAPQGEDHPLLTSNPHDLVPFLELDLYANNNHHQVPDLTTLPSPRFFSTHLPLESLPRSIMETNCKVMYLCRNPKDTFISLWHFANKLMPQEKPTFEDAFDMFCKGVSTYGPYWDHVLGYWKCSLDNPNKVLFIKFEDLKQQPVLHLKRLAEFCGCPFSIEEENEGLIEEIIKLCSFDSLSNLEVNKSGICSTGLQNQTFFRKGEVGDGANYLSREMIERLDKISEEKLHSWGLKF